MISKYQHQQFSLYKEAKRYFIENFNTLIQLENFISNKIFNILSENINEIIRDYNEASYLYPFWKNYPPDDRGRGPRADQYPWIEVGEHTIGAKLPRFLEHFFEVRDTGFPTGTDQRFILTNQEINNITNNYTDSCWLFLDIKSTGPRDDQSHTVMSHNQISGNGIWDAPEKGIHNNVLKAMGKRTSHDFHASMPPIFVLSDNTVAPIVLMAIKPVYTMLPRISEESRNGGQPLIRIDIASIPNGLLLTTNPGYLEQHPTLLFPGKDDKTKKLEKLRARVDFNILKSIDEWRVRTINIQY